MIKKMTTDRALSIAMNVLQGVIRTMDGDEADYEEKVQAVAVLEVMYRTNSR